MYVQLVFLHIQLVISAIIFALQIYTKYKTSQSLFVILNTMCPTRAGIILLYVLFEDWKLIRSLIFR